MSENLPPHPPQPLVLDEDGVVRFRENKVVRYLLTKGPVSLQDVAHLPFTDEDQTQLAQLLGYSVSGFGDLDYASPESVQRADQAALILSKASGSESDRRDSVHFSDEQAGMEELMKRSGDIVKSAPPGGFTRALVLLETKDGNYLTLHRGDDMEDVVENACVAMGAEPFETADPEV